MKTSRLCIIILLTAITFPLHSQTDNYYFFHYYEAWEGGVDFGVNSFFGDVNDNTNKIFPATPFQASFYKNRHFVIGGYFGKRMTPFWTLAVEFKLANVSGKDKYTSREFKSYLNNEIVISNTLDILSMCNLDTKWAVYPKIGLGLYGFRSTLWNTGTGEIRTYPDNYETIYSSLSPAPKPKGYRYTFGMPVGIGGSFRPIPELRIFLETGITWIASDYVDVVLGERSFEGVWNTVIGVSYQFDFPVVRGGNPRSNTANDALKDDGVTKQYKKMRYRSNLGTGKPRYSKSSAMKKHK